MSLLLVFKFSTEVLSWLLLFGFRIIDRWFECSIFADDHDHGGENLIIFFLVIIFISAGSILGDFNSLLPIGS
ncbi:MAG: hypothetical protein DWI06_01645 [Planctomycetota bacterium]|nr:MAG: hypothetical protein DWI06_01645 [Planctomycetota bacterium]